MARPSSYPRLRKCMNPGAIYALRISETWVQLSAFVLGPGARARGASDSRQDAALVCQCEGGYEKKTSGFWAVPRSTG
jgi:hypothetical protein